VDAFSKRMVTRRMSYRVVLYCPDNHILSNWKIVNETGVGGGITARTRISHALAKRGHYVVSYVNCPRDEKIQGVEYRHFSGLEKVDTDIFIASSSGGALELGSLKSIPVQARIKILMILGNSLPENTDPGYFDSIYILSNYVRGVAQRQWQVEPDRLFVSYLGIAEENFPPPQNRRDPFQMAYLSHPSKGLDAAIAVTRILRRSDPRFTLHVFGGNRLWGGVDEPVYNEPGVVYHGLVGQQKLARHLQQTGFSLNLQAREEPFGMVVTESMRAGCIVLASPVGAYPELIRNGYNGFLVPGSHIEPETHQYAAALIERLVRNPDYMECVRRNAVNTPMGWEVVAKTWEGHWNWRFTRTDTQYLGKCSLCQGELLMLADGLHCTGCGHYQQTLNGNDIHSN
jgi:glycosyltransferase involved in cell wall biosynthesis